jgi:choline dehydrogenase
MTNVGLLAVAAMHPFSRGSIHIQSTDPLLQPLIYPRYCSNPLDCQVLVEGFLFSNQLVNTTSMKLLQPILYYRFLQDATVDTLIPAIKSGIRTEFHGSGATSMLPLEHGGVVDTHLRVYGTKTLRIVDVGIIPLVLASHLQASVYAIAEKVGLHFLSSLVLKLGLCCQKISKTNIGNMLQTSLRLTMLS